MAVIKKNKGILSRSLKQRDVAIGVLLLLPATASIIVFKYIPMLLGVFISFFDLNIVKMPGEFVGFDNYIRLFLDQNFYSSILNNIKMFVYSMVMTFWIPIILAILINEIRKGKTAFRLAYFIPGCAPGIAMTVLWKYFWQPDYGLANYLIGLLGISPQLWLNDVNLVYFCMTFPGMIVCGGMNLIIYLAALQSISPELYEATVVDGAGFIQRIRYVTLPQIKDTVILIFTMSVMGILNAMENVMVLTGGGPANSTRTVLLYAYRQATDSMDYSYTIAMTTTVFVLTMIITVIIRKIQDRKAD